MTLIFYCFACADPLQPNVFACLLAFQIVSFSRQATSQSWFTSLWNVRTPSIFLTHNAIKGNNTYQIGSHLVGRMNRGCPIFRSHHNHVREALDQPHIPTHKVILCPKFPSPCWFALAFP